VNVRVRNGFPTKNHENEAGFIKISGIILYVKSSYSLNEEALEEIKITIKSSVLLFVLLITIILYYN